MGIQRPKIGVNDLQSINPKLALEWHPTKNGELTPGDVKAFSAIKVWWLYPYDDPTTGKHFDFEWQASVVSRMKAPGCPFISGQRVWEGFNDFASQYPVIAKEWHPTKNEAQPSQYTVGSSKKVWWLYPYDDPTTGKHFDFEWQATIISRVQGNGCPFLSKHKQKVWMGFNDLATTNPELAKQWHPTKNGNIKASDYTSGSEKKVWWLYPYDDPVTGKHFDFEWQASIKDRARHGYGCPFLSVTSPKVWVGFNDLATTNVELASEWHPTKNGTITPKDVTAGSQKYAWWRCHKGHEWRAVINSRNRGRRCPVCSEEISTSFPEQTLFYYIQKIFPSAKNRFMDFGFELDVYIPDCRIGIEYDGQQYHKNVERDIKKDRQAEAESIKLIRIREPKCPVLSSSSFVVQRINLTDKGLEQSVSDTISIISRIIGKQLKININIRRDYIEILNLTERLESENSLAALYPDLANEWHPTKNGKVSPQNTLPGSVRLIWWRCEQCGYEWQATPNSRTNVRGNTNGQRGTGCPVCGKRKQWDSFNRTLLGNRGSLLDENPVLAKEWDYEKNGELKPSQVTPNSKRMVWWKCDNGHSWKAQIQSRNGNNNGCPYCSNKKVLAGYNDLATKNPELAEEWNYERNKTLHDGNGRLCNSPQMVTPGSSLKVWWKCNKGHEWQASVKTRSANGHGCPYCASVQVITGTNDLATVNPELASEWHPTKNGELTPNDVFAGSSKKVWWLHPYDDPATGKHFDFEWQATIVDRNLNGHGCPFLAKGNPRVWIGFNDLATVNPGLANEWHPTKNGTQKPSGYTAGSGKKVWWICPYDDPVTGKHFDFEWQATISDRNNGSNCPFTNKRNPKVWSGFNDLATLSPELAKEWNYEKNYPLLPTEVTNGSSKRVWWKCPICGNEWRISICNRKQGWGKCSVCKARNKEVRL